MVFKTVKRENPIPPKLTVSGLEDGLITDEKAHKII